MPRAHQEWTVLPHGRVATVEDNLLWTVTGTIHMPLTELPRRMTVARIAGNRLVVFSAIALDEAGMRKLETFGQPAFLVVPNDKHRLDAKIWKDRYPQLQVVAPEGSKKGVEDVVPVGTCKPRFDDPNVEFITVPGTRRQEAALLVHAPGGTTLVLNDLVGNIRHSPGFGGWFLRITRFAGDEPQIPLPVQWTMIDDKAALSAQLLRWAELPDLRRILVSHGAAIEDEPAEALRDLAHSLSYDAPQHGRAKAA